jgi:hypothetical protein
MIAWITDNPWWTTAIVVAAASLLLNFWFWCAVRLGAEADRQSEEWHAQRRPEDEFPHLGV